MSAAALHLGGPDEIRPDLPATFEVTISNIGGTVESYALVVLGDLAATATVAPPEIRLFPGEQGTATVTVVVGANVPAGPTTLAVKAQPQTDAAGTAVEERQVQVAEVTRFEIRAVPMVLRARRRGQVSVEVVNTGNAPVTVALTAEDPNEELVAALHPPTLTVGPHGAETSNLSLRSIERHATTIGYTVRGHSPDGSEAQVDPRLEIRRRRPLPIVLVAAALLLGLVAALTLTGGNDSEAIRLADSGTAESLAETSTTVAGAAVTTTIPGATPETTVTADPGATTTVPTGQPTTPTSGGTRPTVNSPGTPPPVTTATTTRAPRPPCTTVACQYVLRNSGPTKVVDTRQASGGASGLVVTQAPPRTAHGTVTIGDANTTIFYKPDAGYVGSDLLRYSVSDGRGDPVAAELTIHVVTS